MFFETRKQDLFDVGEDFHLAHCISADYALGAGIAVEFQRRYQLREQLKQIGTGTYPDCILTGRVFNLITKQNYWNKPTYDALEETLHLLLHTAGCANVHKIAMPRIGCGLDRLHWPRVLKVLEDVFQHANMHILVCDL